MLLSQLAALLTAAGVRADVVGADVALRGVASDSRRVAPGDLFVALAGETHDGTSFVADARAAGAVALCARQADPTLPSLVVEDPRAVLGRLAVAVYEAPARQLPVLGITGTLGKTSTAHLLAHVLEHAVGPTGVIGSLGIHVPGRSDHEVGMTTPEAPVIQRELRAMVDARARAAVMEVSSHSLLLGRVDALELALGVFLNLVPDEHLEFHPTPEHYVRTKLRFFELLRPDAPLVHNADDPRTREAAANDAAQRPDAPIVGVSSHEAPDAAVWVRVESRGVGGSRIHLEVRRPLPRLGGGTRPPASMALDLPLLGRQLAWNAAIAVTAALVVGADPAALAAAVRTTPPIHRRMELVHGGGPIVIDDTSGNPRSLLAVADAAATIDRGRTRVVYVVRGMRGPTINAKNGRALVEFSRLLDAELVVCSSDDHADARNRVQPEERAAVCEALDAAQVPYTHAPTLAGALDRVLADARPDDLLLLLGAQGMDAGAALVRQRLGVHVPDAS